MIKLKALSIAASLAVVTLVGNPFPASAQPVEPAERAEALAEELNLTASQRSQLQEIRNTTRSQLLDLLNPEQQQTLQQALASGQLPRVALGEMDLSTDQKRQIRATLQAARQEIGDVLTPEQRQQLQQTARSRFRQRGLQQ